MMGKIHLFSEFPERIDASSERPHLLYHRLPEHYAIHGPLPTQLAHSVLVHFPGQSIAVCRGMPDPQLMQTKSLSITPVYALEPNGPFAVPTGLVFVRFKEGMKAEAQEQNLASTGYTITDIPLYAPHTAWVRHQSEDIATALTNLASLVTLSDVVNVEPQMLTKAARRSDPTA
jgi:hypothetical protein